MNWLKRFKSILGSFWFEIFQPNELISCIVKAYTQVAQQLQLALDSFVATLDINKKTVYINSIPRIIYLKKERIDLKTGKKSTCIDLSTYPLETVLTGKAELGSPCVEGYYVAKTDQAVNCPWYLTGTTTKGTELILTEGADFTYENSSFNFYTDIRKLGLPELTLHESETVMLICYKLLCYSKPYQEPKEVNTITETTSIPDCASIIWKMQLQGASTLSAKILLATVTGSVFCTKDGVVTHSWVEQGYQHLLIADELYSAPLSAKCHVQHGDNVKAGQLLFGSLILNTYKDALPAYEEVPGITVQTDVGEVQLLNKEQDAVQYGDTYYLPVVADADTKAAYYKRCQELKDNKIVDVPATVNPFALVRELRGANFAYASFDVSDVKRTSEAINHIRNTISAGSMFTVYVKAQSDPLVLNLYSFTASAGSCALSVCATLNVIEAASEAHVSL